MSSERVIGSPLPAAGEATAGALGVYLQKRSAAALQALLGMLDRAVGGRASTRFLTLAAVYTVICAATFYLAYELRWDFAVPPEFLAQRRVLLVPVIVCKLLLLYSFGQFRSVLSYFSLADLAGVGLGMSFVSGLMLLLWYGATSEAAPPRGVVLMDFVLSVSALAAFRLSLRVARTWASSGLMRTDFDERRVAIIGSGDAGEALAKSLLSRRGTGRRPVFFIDDDPKRIGRNIHGLPVYGPMEKLGDLGARAHVNEFVITLADAGPKQVKAITAVAREIGASTLILPSFNQLASGAVKVERTRPVAIEDLLGRDPVNLDSAGIARLLHDRVVMITGAGGSIGSELCRQIAALEPRRLILVDQTEIALFEIEQELLGTSAQLGRVILPLIVDVSDEAAVRTVFSQHRPQIVFHAAAHKHVPLMERQPAEAVKNNTLATAALTRIASESGVERFVFISTDKAVNPTSVMGCSKRLAEKALQARHHAPGNTTTFMAVRFGNVLGSSGSVIPTFRRQIAQGGPVTVTHPEMTRYFMTIPEAVGLVLQAATQGRGGEIFILDMSQPVKIIDMARQMIELSGYKPDLDIEIKITGLRPGEKLYEELRHTEETHEPTEHPRIFKLKSATARADASPWLEALRHAADSNDARTIKDAMKRLVPEYTPFNS
jgi:FlaA1/EpsC-like NDP-sugar epimerase